MLNEGTAFKSNLSGYNYHRLKLSNHNEQILVFDPRDKEDSEKSRDLPTAANAGCQRQCTGSAYILHLHLLHEDYLLNSSVAGCLQCAPLESLPWSSQWGLTIMHHFPFLQSPQFAPTSEVSQSLNVPALLFCG